MHRPAGHAARRAVGLRGGFHTDKALPESEDLSISDSLFGQVEDGGGSIRARGRRLDQGS